jgi:hypothetical protein
MLSSCVARALRPQFACDDFIDIAPHASPRSIERISGCRVCRKCRVACRFLEESQHPT